MRADYQAGYLNIELTVNCTHRAETVLENSPQFNEQLIAARAVLSATDTFDPEPDLRDEALPIETAVGEAYLAALQQSFDAFREANPNLNEGDWVFVASYLETAFMRPEILESPQENCLLDYFANGDTQSEYAKDVDYMAELDFNCIEGGPEMPNATPKQVAMIAGCVFEYAANFMADGKPPLPMYEVLRGFLCAEERRHWPVKFFPAPREGQDFVIPPTPSKGVSPQGGNGGPSGAGTN